MSDDDDDDVVDETISAHKWDDIGWKLGALLQRADFFSPESGGAQNVKMKNSDKVDKFDKPPKSTTGFRGLKGIL